MPSGSGFVHGMSSLSSEPASFAPWDALPDAVVVTKPNGTVTFANRAAAALLGWASAELVSQPVDVLIAEQHRPLVALGAGWREVTARHRDGTELPVELWVAEQGAAVVVVLRDRRQALATAEAEARTARHRQQADRLDGLAELAGSLAH